MDLSPLLHDLSRKAREANPPAPEDYTQDGLLYCGRCRTPKEYLLRLQNTTMKVSCLCSCASEALQAAEAAERERQRAMELQQMADACFPEAGLRLCTFDRDDGSDPRLGKVARRYVDRFETLLPQGTGLLFYGSVGTGKTYMAAAIANALLEKGHPCLVTSFARLANRLAEYRGDRTAWIDGLSRYDLLVIDDLAAERDTEYMNELVQTILDARYRQQKPMIVTTNLSAQELKNPAQLRRQRVYSRLMERCYPVEVTGPDRRKLSLRDRYKDLHAMLEE